MLVIWFFHKKSENVGDFFQNMLTSMDLGSNLHDHVGIFFSRKMEIWVYRFKYVNENLEVLLISKCKSDENRSQAREKIGIVDF